MYSLKILQSFRIPPDAQSFLLPPPSLGYRNSGKEVEVRDSGSWHHQLCGCHGVPTLPTLCGSLPLLHQSHVVFSWVWLPCLGLNPSTSLPLQPHFRLLLQPVTPASIPVFFQLYWAAIVSLGRCGPMAWSQSSPSSYAGAITRGSCFPVTSWVEFTPISLAQNVATAILHIYETS